MDTPDNRTHGAHSAVDDEIPHNMTDVADARTVVSGEELRAPAGMEAIPADMPDSPRTDTPLEYTLQNFNGLVAANTALETELSAGAERERALNASIVLLHEQLAESRRTAEVYEAHAERYSKLAQERKTELDNQTSDLAYARDEAQELRRKLDRMSGYLDRVLDDEDGMRAPETRQVPALKPMVGPDFDDIPRAVRRNARGDTDMGYAFRGERVMHSDEMPRRRRY